MHILTYAHIVYNVHIDICPYLGRVNTDIGTNHALPDTWTGPFHVVVECDSEGRLPGIKPLCPDGQEFCLFLGNR